MVVQGAAWAAVTEDGDTVVFGCTRVLRGGIAPRIGSPLELVELRAVLDGLGMSGRQLRMLAAMTGTDFHPQGVPGIGCVRAWKLLRCGAEATAPAETIESALRRAVMQSLSIGEWSEQAQEMLDALHGAEAVFGTWEAAVSSTETVPASVDLADCACAIDWAEANRAVRKSPRCAELRLNVATLALA